MMESASEDKFNVKQTGHYSVDLYDYCTSYSAKELKKTMTDSLHDRSLEGKESKIRLIENIRSIY